jgi:hypothetical protein
MYYEPQAVYEAMKARGWVCLASGPYDTQMAADLLRKRVYGAAARLGKKASTTNKIPGFILGWLREGS